MGKKVLSPSELIELRTRQQEEEKILAAKLEEEKNKIQEGLKRILSPSDLFGPKLKSTVKEEKIVEIIEEKKDPIEVLQERIEEVSATIKEPKYYDQEISQVNTIIDEIKRSIPKVPKVKYYDNEIQSILEKLDSLDIRYYESDLQVINERLNHLQSIESRNIEDIQIALKQISKEIENLYELEILDPKETHEYINSIKESFSNKVDNLKVQLSELPKVKYYDDELTELKDKIEFVRNSIPEIPEIRYYDDELKTILETIEHIRSNIPIIPEVRYYENEISYLEESIKQVENKVSKFPEVRYYDSEIGELKENIKSIENKIPVIPEIRYYDEQIERLQESIKDVDNKIPTIPEVKYYDAEISEVNDTLEKIKGNIHKIQKLVDSIDIPEQIDWSNDIQGIYEEIKKLKEVPIITESNDPLVPLDQNFATLDDLQNHYKLFINRIQQQLSSLGGGGETRLEFLDDIDRSTAKTDGYFLKYQQSSGKWIGASVSGSGASDYASFAGIATYANFAGISTLADFATTAGTASTASFATTSYYLNGQIGSYYLDYNNFNNVPQIPSDTGDLTNSVGFVTSSIVVGLASEGYVDNLVAISTFSGDYNDLNNTPLIPSIVGLASEGYVDNLVAISTFSGDYNDLNNTPTIPSDTGDLTNSVGFVTSSIVVGYATESYVDNAIANLIDNAPSALDTLKELATALGDDENFSTTVTNSLASKANLSGANFVGIVTAPTFIGNLEGTASIASTASFATTSYYLNGQLGSYYLDYNNFNNTPFIPTDTGDLTNSVGFITSYTEVDTLDNVLFRGNTSGIGISVGLSTFSNNVIVNGSITSTSHILPDGLISSGSYTTTTLSETSIDSFSTTTYRSAKYQIQITRGSEYQVTEIFIVHDGTLSYLTEYATIKTSSALGVFSSDITGGNVRLLVSPSSNTSTTFKLIRTLIEV